MNYGNERNVSDRFVYTIIQSNDGFLWVGTANGLSRFDGYNFFPVEYPDTSGGRYPTKSLKDKNGTLWFGCSDGTVLYEKSNKLIIVPLQNTKSISELLEGPDGLIYVITQGKAVFSINPLKPAEIHQYIFSIEPVLFSGSFTNTGNLLIGTQENLLLCKLDKDSVSVIKVIEGFNSYAVKSIHKIGDGSRFLIGTDDNGLFLLKISDGDLTRLPDHPELNSLRVQSIIEGSEGSLWISTTGSGVIQLDLSNNFGEIKSV
jgi:ligand-binding sensor domain-containing protein